MTLIPSLKRLLLAAVLAWLPQQALALCTLVCACSASTTAVAFGTYNPISGADLTGTGNVRVTCGGVLGLAVPYTVALDTGTYGTAFARKMGNGTKRLNYNLYTDTGAVWGNGSGGTETMGGQVDIILLGGTSQNLAVKGKIPGGQSTVAPGNFTDTVTVTITYL